MAVGHHQTNEESVSKGEGYYYVITCACGEAIEAGPEASSLYAKVRAMTAFGFHKNRAA